MNTKAIGFFLLLVGLLFIQASWGQQWHVRYDESKVGFVATYDEIPFEGRFEDFDADISFDPRALDQATFNVNVAVASVNSDSPDRDEGMLEQDWFDVTQHPNSSFTSTTFAKLEGTDRYEVMGDLRIKGITKPVTLVFTWEASEKSVRLFGQTHVKRTDFKVGTGDWEDDDTIGFDVQIVFDLNLHK